MSNLDLMKTGIGVAVLIGLVLTAAGAYAIVQTLGGVGGTTISPDLAMSVVFGVLLLAAAAAVTRFAPRPRTRV